MIPQPDNVALDSFPCGCLITHGHDASGPRLISYANRYVHELLQLSAGDLQGRPLSQLLTRASAILLESYVLPNLLHNGRCDEMLLEVRTEAGVKVPVICNAVRSPGAPEQIHWSLFNATRRNQLYNELLEMRRALEARSQRLETLSVTDDLTGLMNRRELRKQVELMVELTRETGGELAFMLVDIDHFKRINDDLGHATGDRVLRQLGALFREHCREADIVARYGGEEFVFVLGKSTLDGAMGLARRIQQVAAQVQVGQVLTVSIGLTMSAARARADYDTLFAAADKALYRAKDAGRNRIELQAASYEN